MAQLAPPEYPPCVAVADDDDLRRLRFRLWQVSVTMLTVLVTAWFMTLGPIPGIIAVVTAKHVLVAVLMMRLRVNATEGVDL